MNRRSLVSSTLAGALVALLPLASHAEILLYDKDGLSFRTGGFVEMDADFDTTRTFDEVVGNKAIPYGLNGATGRQTFSIRNSRLFFKTDYKPSPDAIATRGYFEFDLLGLDPSSTNLSPYGNSTEASFFNNATLRVRHAYVEASKDGWAAMAGQYWELFGWQPYYFMSSVDVQPIPAMVYTRTPQFRALKTGDLGGDTHFEAAFAIARAPQRDASLPDFQAGIRLTDTRWEAASGLGASGKLAPQPLSIGVSGLFREFVTNSNDGVVGDLTHYPAAAVAVNAFAPLLPCSASSLSSLAFIASFTTGTGYGDQFNGWTGGTASNLNLATGFDAAFPYKTNLDGGIGDFDANGDFHLIQLTSFNLNLQYTFPFTAQTWLDGGYGRLSSDNIDQLANNGAGTGSSGNPLYNAVDDFYINAFRQVTTHIRLGLEYLRVRTRYVSGNALFDNRYQFSTFFIF